MKGNEYYLTKWTYSKCKSWVFYLNLQQLFSGINSTSFSFFSFGTCLSQTDLAVFCKLYPLLPKCHWCMSVGRTFSKGGARGFFQNFSRDAKSGEICFYPLETKKATFLLKFLKSREGQGTPAPPPLPTPTDPLPTPTDGLMYWNREHSRLNENRQLSPHNDICDEVSVLLSNSVVPIVAD